MLKQQSCIPVPARGDSAVILTEQQMFADGLKHMLLAGKKMLNVTCCLKPEDAFKLLDSFACRFMFIDMQPASGSFNSLILNLRRKYPELIITVVSSVVDVHVIRGAFNAGINSYVSKFVGAQELDAAMEKNIQGDKYVSTDIMPRLALESICGVQESALTKREMEIVRFVAQGFTISQTASEMCLSHHTIITHRRNIMNKLKMRSAVDVARFAITNNLVAV